MKAAFDLLSSGWVLRIIFSRYVTGSRHLTWGEKAQCWTFKCWRGHLSLTHMLGIFHVNVTCFQCQWPTPPSLHTPQNTMAQPQMDSIGPFHSLSFIPQSLIWTLQDIHCGLSTQGLCGLHMEPSALIQRSSLNDIGSSPQIQGHNHSV